MVIKIFTDWYLYGIKEECELDNDDRLTLVRRFGCYAIALHKYREFEAYCESIDHVC